jgi:hypothetical protein
MTADTLNEPPLNILTSIKDADCDLFEIMSRASAARARLFAGEERSFQFDLGS